MTTLRAVLGEGRGPEIYFVFSSCGLVRIPEQRSTQQEDEVLGFMRCHSSCEKFSTYTVMRALELRIGGGEGAREKRTQHAIPVAPLSTMNS